MSNIRSNRYVSIGQLGPKTTCQYDPAIICAFGDINKTFAGGEMGYYYGAENKLCQIYMAQRSAKKWDMYSEHMSNNTSPASYQNVYPFAGTLGGTANNIQTIGDGQIVATAQYKFCDMINPVVNRQHLFPTDASSPMVDEYISGMPTVKASFNPDTIDQDYVMNKMLDRGLGDALLVLIFNSLRQNYPEKFQRFLATRAGRHAMWVLGLSNHK